MKKMAGSIWALALVLFMIFPMTGFAAGDKTIKIGFLTPLTGPFAAEGKKMVDGAKFAIWQINSTGGLLGKEVEMITYDVGQFKPELIMSGAKKLVAQDKVALMTTGYLGGVTDIKTMSQYDVPYIHSDTSHLAAKSIMENPKEHQHIFQVSPEESELYRGGLYDLIVNTPWKHPNKKIAIITMDRAYNRIILDANLDSLKTEVSRVSPGWEVVINEMTPTGATEWGPILSKIRKENPSVILFNDHVITDEASFLKQFLRNPTQSVIGMIYGPQNPDFLQLAGSDAEGLLWTGGGNAVSPNEKGKKLTEDFKKVTGIEPPPSLCLLVWAGIKLWAESVKTVGDERKYYEICRYMKGRVWEMPEIISPYVFDQHTNTVLVGDGLFVQALYQIQNGKNLIISPKVHATGSFKRPRWLTQ
jgi:branched-chain amino acid transport system substrate-binding protein